MLVITFIRSYFKTKNTSWLYFAFFLCFILFFSMLYLNVFSFLYSQLKVSTNNPILEFSSIMIVTYIGIFFLQSNS
jgi:hypothetical protein